MCFGFNQAIQIPANTDHQCDAKDTQQKFSERSTELQPERHSVVLGKVNQKPITDYMKFLAEVQMCFDPDFKNLVDQQYKKNNQECAFQELKIEY